MTTTEQYDEWYFANCCGVPYRRDEHWLAQFGAIADRIVEDISPKSALDAGCAMGFLVEALRDRGVDAEGIDVSDYALEHVREDIKPFCRKASVLDPLPRRYDVIVCIEVLEHLTPEEGDTALDNICADTDDVFFSSTPHDFNEASHLNVQPPEYWAERFARRGFFRDVDFDATVAARWSVRFRKDAVSVPRVVAGYERRLWRLAQENDAVRDELLSQRDRVARAESEREEAQVAATETQARVEAERNEAHARADAAEAAVAALQSTKTFRYTRPLRDLYKSLRDRRTAAKAVQNDPLAAEFAARGPWVTRFLVNGRSYGGSVAFDDPRVEWFFQRFPEGGRVLELGSLEGGQSFQLAARAARVTAVEGRHDNVERARFVQNVLGIANVDFVEADLEQTPLRTFGRFDAVFCSGLLYHLPRPWELIAQFGAVAPGVFVWTHYARAAETTAGGVAGIWYSERPAKDPLSGLSPRSFWPTLPELRRLLAEAGLVRIDLVRDEPDHEHGPVVTLAAWAGEA